MKFVIIGPVYPYRGGIAHHTAMLSLALQKADHYVNTISFKRQYPNWLYPGKTDKDPSRYPLRSKAEYVLDPLLPWTWLKAINITLSSSPDLVIIPWWTTFWSIPFAVISRRLVAEGIPVTFIIHNVLPHEPKSWDRMLAKLALSGGQAYIVQSKNEQDQLVKLVPNTKVEICPHPIYTFFSENKLEKTQAKQALGLVENIPLLLFFGFVRPYKGLHILLDALKLLKTEEIDFYQIIAGEFWEDANIYLERIDELNLAKQIRVENRYIPDEEVNILFSAADLFIAPYTSGTQSGVIKIALGYGLPIVTTNIMIDEMIFPLTDHQLFVYDSTDPIALADNMKIALEKTTKIEPRNNLLDDSWGRLVQTIDLIAKSEK